MRRYYFTRCALQSLSKAEQQTMGVCHIKHLILTGWYHYEEVEGDLRHIEFECEENPCKCAGILKPWEDRWSKMPKRL